MASSRYLCVSTISVIMSTSIASCTCTEPRTTTDLVNSLAPTELQQLKKVVGTRDDGVLLDRTEREVRAYVRKSVEQGRADSIAAVVLAVDDQRNFTWYPC